MDDKKEPRIYVHDLPSQSSFGTSRPIYSRHESSAPPDLWPSQPQVLKDTKLSKWVNYTYDAALCIAPILLMAKIGLVIWASMPENDGNILTTYLTEFNNQLSTLYTVIFMTTIATLFKRFALWKAQEGATVAELEQYQASISLPGTLKMIVLLRAFSWTSAGLVLLWSWFYLGSQAVSREYAKADSRPYNDTKLIFPSPEAPSIFERSPRPNNMEIVQINSIFMSAMQVNSQTTEQKASEINSRESKLHSWASDSYNAALIPLMETYSYSGLEPADHNGWRKVSDGAIIEYTANSGIPVLLGIRNPSGEPDVQYFDYNSHFIGTYTLNTSYIFPNCSDIIFSGPSAFPSNAKPGFTTFFNPTNHTVDNLPAVDIWTRDTTTNNTVRGRCTLARHYVDVEGECDMIRCGSKRVRYSTNKETPSPETPFKDQVFSQLFFSNLLHSAGNPEGSESMSPVLSSRLFYTNLTSSFENITYGKWQWKSEHSDSNNASLQLILSQRLSYLINTYMCASQPNGGLLSPFDALNDMTFDEQKALIDISPPLNHSWSTTTTANGAPYESTWILVIPWIILDFMTCTILLLAAFASVWLRVRTVCPDVFGYVSSMTRDNPHIPVPKGGSTMSGIERARAMKNVRVKIGELERQDGAPGHIGLALEHPEIPMDRLRRKGQYL